MNKHQSEVWKPIAGYEGLYEVSNFGRVRNASKAHCARGGILKPLADATGYCRINVYKGGKMAHKLVHRVVAEAFVENPQSKTEVNHKDGNKANNAATNLEWVTPKENIKHSIYSGLRSNRKPVDMYTTSGEFLKTFESLAEAAKHTGAKVHNISRCCTGRKGYKTACGYVWKYR
jgi:hypothetical protein